MVTPRRIDITLLDSELKDLVNASTKIFPMSYEDISANLNPNNYEYVKCLDTEHKREIYTWDDGRWELIGADDIDINWTDIKEKPAAFMPITHNHVKAEVTDFAHTHPKTEISDFDHTHLKKDVTDFTHAHLKGDITDFAHTHTKTEISDFAHNHTKTEITDFDHNHDTSYYTKTQVDTALSGKSDSTHNHDGRYFTESEVTSKLATKSDATHNHDTSYSNINHNHDTAYAIKTTESTVADHETRLSNIEGGYLEGHTHSNLTTLNKLAYTGVDASLDLKQIETNASNISTLQTSKSDTSHTHTQSEITDFPIIPAKTSQLTNDSDFQNSTQVVTAIGGKADKSYVDTELAKKADSTTLSGHTGNTTVHVTQTDKNTWNTKQDALSGDVTGHYHTADRYTIAKTDVESVLTGVISSHSHASGTPTSHATTHVTGGADVIANTVANGNSGLMSGDDKAKLDGIADNANNYVHPSTHSISEVSGLQTALNGKVDNSRVLTDVPLNAIFTDTVYTHPASHPASIVTQDASNRFVTDIEKATWSGKAEGTHSHAKSQITDFPALSTVATSGSYADLSNKPTIPTKTSELTNDSGFAQITSGTVPPSSGWWFKEV